MADAPATSYARTAEGGYLAYQVFGDGPVDLVVQVNGGYAIDLLWDEPLFAAGMRRLASFSRVITFDPRGFGSSSPIDPERVPAIQTWMDDLGTVMDAAGSEKAALLSWAESTQAMMLFAATYPHRVRGLVLVNGYARFLRSDDCPWGYPVHLFPRYVEAIQEAWGTGAVTAILAPSMVRTEEARHRWARCERLSATPASIAVPRAFMESDVSHVLAAVQAPALVVSRRGDRHVRAEHSRYLASRITGAKLVELRGDDDFAFSGNAEELLDEVQEFITGVRPAPALERVLATVLFTDIVESTQRAAALGDRHWREVLNAYDELVRDALHRFRGRLVKSTGDGTLAVFDGPARAIECARTVAGQIKSLQVDLRAGLHTGEIETRGDDVAGMAVHIAARISALAAAGEVLVSRTVSDLVAGSGIVFEDRGEHQLKGVPGAWRLFAVSS